ncbi:MAG: hypothetical protein ACRER9_05490, partial [Gammaproteobacteria bacterium]
MAAPRTCPICGTALTPDQLGLVECACGWGGPGDPLEAAHGLSRVVTRLDRRWATAQARRELARLAARQGQPPRPGLFYVSLLAIF